MAGSISGLASGLDTATIISQLMQLEAVPQDRIKKLISGEQRQVNSLQTLNGRIAGLATKAEALADVATWAALKVTSSSDKITVTSREGASPASLSVTVDATALSHQLGFLDAAALTDVVTTGSTSVRIDRLDGTTLDVETGDGSLQGLVAALNDPDNATGLRASAIRTGDGQYRLLVESATTGAAADFTLKNLDGTDLLGGSTVRAARDARISLGAGIAVTSASNTFADVLPGVDITIAAGTATGTTGDLTVVRDQESLTRNVTAFVDAINAALQEIDGLTSYDPATKASGMLAGDPGVRSLRTRLLESVYPGDGTSLAGVGIEVDRSGKLVFDPAAFSAAYAADPAGVTARFATNADEGFAARVHAVADAASNKVDGTLTTAITGRNDGIRRMEDSIAQWDVRLELRRATLTRQFTALEVALSQMTSQSNWLAGQIGTLSTSSGS